MAKTTKKPRQKHIASAPLTGNAPKRIFQKGNKKVVSFRQRALARRRNFLSRRTHRSFQRTRRRDYVRSLPLPGYIALTTYVYNTVKLHRNTFLLLFLTYTFVIILIGGVTSQETYAQIQELLESSSKDVFGSGIDDIGKAGLLAVSAFAGLPATLTVDQQIYLAIALMFAWLCSVWLLREFLLGRKPKLRDGLYNSGSPFIATTVITIIILLQLLPVGIIALIYGALSTVGIIDGGFSSMLFWVFAGTVATLVLYWITSSILALVIVTLPGMYPLKAMKAASDIVLGRRIRILYRLLWGILMLALVWAVVIIPAILLNSLAISLWPGVQSIPFIPYVGALLTAGSVVLYAAYVYLFYRKVVDNV